MIDIENLSLTQAKLAFEKKELSPRELVDAYLQTIEKRDPSIHAYLEVFADDVRKEAKLAEEAYRTGNALPLQGIPVAVKDNILIQGKTASAGSKILESFVAPYDATAIRKLKEAGTLFLGRTNMDEFAMGSSTENSAFGPTKNPLDEKRVPGGSSGGSAAAVAMHGALGALGSDTGGSVRQPASFCGCVGLKPTYGAVSRFGLMAMGSSLDQIGTITKTVADAKTLFEHIRGADPLDSTSWYPDQVKKETKKTLVFGVPRNLLEGLDPAVAHNFELAIEKLHSLGHTVVDIGLPNLSLALSAYYVIMPAEVSSNLARFDGVKYGLHVDGNDLLSDYLKTRREGFGNETRRRIMLGTYVLSSGYYDAFYGKANALREHIRRDYNDAFTSVDMVLTPTTPTPAFLLGEKVDDPLAMYLADMFTIPANISGHPALSVPSGTVSVDGSDLPLGIQFVAPMHCEDALFVAGLDFFGA